MGCKHPGCDRLHHAKGWCSLHYLRVKQGTPMDQPVRVYGPEPYERLMLMVKWVGECLEFTGYLDSKGYGRLYGGLDVGRPVAVHIIAWEYHNGPVPPGMQVRHYVCDNPPCVNIDHLRLGTPQDNVDDAVRKGRHAHGETHPQSKLTEEQVRYIRASSERGVDLAAMFGVSPATISDARNGRTWRDLL